MAWTVEFFSYEEYLAGKRVFRLVLNGKGFKHCSYREMISLQLGARAGVIGPVGADTLA